MKRLLRIAALILATVVVFACHTSAPGPSKPVDSLGAPAPVPTVTGVDTPTPSTRTQVFPACPDTFPFRWGAPADAATAADGRAIVIRQSEFDGRPWIESKYTDYGQPYADGPLIAWIEAFPEVFPTYRLRAFDCETRRSYELGSRDYEQGQLDVPVVDGSDIVWGDWASRGPENGLWWIRRFNLEDGETTVLLDSADFLPEPGAVAREPLVAEPAIDDGRFITWIKSAEPDVTNILVGNLDGTSARLVTDVGPLEVGPDVEVAGEQAVYLRRDLVQGEWTWDVYLYDFASGETRRLTEAVGDSRTYELPAIDGEYAAYVETIPVGDGTYSVWLQRLKDGQRWALSPYYPSENVGVVKMGGGWVVWETAYYLNLVSVDDISTIYRLRIESSALQLEVHNDSLVWISYAHAKHTGVITDYQIYWFRLPHSG